MRFYELNNTGRELDLYINPNYTLTSDKILAEVKIMSLSAISSKMAVAIAIAFIIGIVIGYGSAYFTITPKTHVKTVTLPPSTTTITKTYTKSTTQITTKTTTSTFTPTGKKVTLTVVVPWSGEELKNFKIVINKFEQEHPNIQIQIRIYRAEQVAQIAPPQFAAGMAPGDVIFMCWGWWIQKMAEKGYLVDLSNQVNTSEFIKGIFKPVTVNGHIYGLPFAAWAKPGFWYRKSFFKKYGLQPPKTWDQFLALLKKIKNIPGIVAPLASPDSPGWPLGDIVEHFLITFGSPQLQLELIHGAVKFNSPQVEKIFKDYLVPLLKQGYFGKPVEWTRLITDWWNGKYALYYMGTWITGMVPDPNDLGFFQLPGCKGVVMGTDYIIVPKFTKHLQTALMLAKWLATEGQEIYVGTHAGKLPTWLKVPPNAIWAPVRQVYEKIKNEVPLPDLDDSIGGKWQQLYWQEMELLWVSPDKWQDILNTLTQQFPSK